MHQKIMIIGSHGSGESTFASEFKQWIVGFSKKSIPEIYNLLEKYNEKNSNFQIKRRSNFL